MSETTRQTNSSDVLDSSSDSSSKLFAETRSEFNNSSADRDFAVFCEDRHPLDVLADEYSARLRAGESPSIEDYARRAPELQQPIRTLFPTIALIERITLQDRAAYRSHRHVHIDRNIIGDFQILREMGRGGMGIVYEAIQSSLGRRVALKVFGSGIANSPLQLDRFRREAESAARLHHTNIVPVYGIGEEDGIHFYAMQFIDGIPLADAIATLRRRTSMSHLSDSKAVAQSPPHSVEAGDSNHSDESGRGSKSSVNDPTILVTIDPGSDATNGEGQSLSERFHVKAEGSCNEFAEPASGLPFVQTAEHRPGFESHLPLKSTVESVNDCFGNFTNNTSADYFVRIANLTAQIADALEYAHQHGVLHRDIKPANLMIDRSGGVWVMDFGLVKILEKQDLTLAGEIVGTVRYMAPEQLEGRADARTDVYALGLTLFELLTLKPAFDGDDAVTLAQRLRHSDIPRPRSMNPAIPLDLETIVFKATAREPSARYETAAMLAEDLRRFCDDRPILARRTSYLERMWRWSRRNPALALAFVLSAFLLWLVAVVASVGWFTVESALKEATQAQMRAENNLDSAIDAFDGIMENVTSRGLPRSLSTEPTEAADPAMLSASSEDDVRLLNSLLRFYSRFAIENADNTRLRRRTAVAHRRAGTILVRLGRLNEAEEDFDKAISMFTTILNSKHQSVEAVAELASLHNEIGELYLRRGDFKKTFESHLESRALLLELPAILRKDPTIRFELARATDLFASIDIRSGTDEGPTAAPFEGPNGQPLVAGTDFPAAQADTTDLNAAGKLPEDMQAPWRDRNQGDTGGPPSHVLSPGSGPPPGTSPMEMLSDRWKKALPTACVSELPMKDRLANTLLEASHEFRALIDEFPDDTEYQFRFAQCLRHRLVHAAGSGEQDVVQETFREAIKILETLRAKFPEDPKYLYELAETLTQASRAQSNEQAVESLGNAVFYAELLTDHFPAISDYQRLLGIALARLAAAEDKTNTSSLRNAEVGLAQAIKTLGRLAKRFPDQGIIQIPLAKARQQLGDLLRDTINLSETPEDRLEESLAWLNEAVNGFEEYLSRSVLDAKPKKMGRFNFETRSSLYASLAETLTKLQRLDEAEKARQQGSRHRWPRP